MTTKILFKKQLSYRISSSVKIAQIGLNIEAASENDYEDSFILTPIQITHELGSTSVSLPKANAPLVAFTLVPELLDLIHLAERFISGFEDDDTQDEPVDDLLARLRVFTDNGLQNPPVKEEPQLAKELGLDIQNTVNIADIYIHSVPEFFVKWLKENAEVTYVDNEDLKEHLYSSSTLAETFVDEDDVPQEVQEYITKLHNALYEQGVAYFRLTTI